MEQTEERSEGIVMTCIWKNASDMEQLSYLKARKLI